MTYNELPAEIRRLSDKYPTIRYASVSVIDRLIRIAVGNEVIELPEDIDMGTQIPNAFEQAGFVLESDVGGEYFVFKKEDEESN